MYLKLKTEEEGKNNKSSGSKKPLIIVSLIVTLFGIFLLRGFLKVFNIKSVTNKTPFSTPTITPTPDPLAPKNVLLLGYGGGKHEGGSLTDMIMVTRIIPREKRIVLISIPRDLWIPLPVNKNSAKDHKINEAYPIGRNDAQYRDKPDIYTGKTGGGSLAKYAAGYVLGLPVDNFVAINFSGFIKSIDILGGVTVHVPFSFEDDYYPLEGKEKETCGKDEEEMQQITATASGFILEQQFPCRFEKISFTKGAQRMDGETALKFVRSRHSKKNDGDFGRIQRQQALIKAVKNALLSPGVILKIIPLIENQLKNTDTDISLTDIKKVISDYSDPGLFAVSSVVLSDANVFQATTNDKGTYILVPKKDWDWNKIHDFINFQINPTSLPTPFSES